MENISYWKYIRVGTWTEILILGIQRVIPHDIILIEKDQYRKKLENGYIDDLVEIYLCCAEKQDLKMKY